MRVSTRLRNGANGWFTTPISGPLPPNTAASITANSWSITALTIWCPRIRGGSARVFNERGALSCYAAAKACRRGSLVLVELRLENYAVIDNLVVEFGPGLNLLTGETGAGKSILIDALALLLGEKASTEVIRS